VLMHATALFLEQVLQRGRHKLRCSPYLVTLFSRKISVTPLVLRAATA
jgi:hypothetical protein